jgi:hypothetical protein
MDRSGEGLDKLSWVNESIGRPRCDANSSQLNSSVEDMKQGVGGWIGLSLVDQWCNASSFEGASQDELLQLSKLE